MKLIGIKRVILLSILAGLNAVIAAAYFLWISPMLTDSQNALTAVTSDISSLQTKIQNTKTELAQYKENLPAFELLKAKGFTSSQDRFQMSRDLDGVRQQAQLSGFSFNIADLQLVESAAATAAKLKVLNSRINVDQVASLLDVNFYDFVDRMMHNFPAHVRLRSLEVKRKEPLNNYAFTRISHGEPVNLLLANASFDWITVVPEAAPTDPNNPNAPRQ
ncbi:MAG TPA: hypothetical protein VEF76_11985 [Patescibacteria group bacterium]|nr:hypothetical protein [Patescibacteria group bacterium]